MSWVLPYAQRYICYRHHERYLQLRLSGFEKLNRLQIVVVEKLFYKNVIRRSNMASKKRHGCSCLLQVLYSFLHVYQLLGPITTRKILIIVNKSQNDKNTCSTLLLGSFTLIAANLAKINNVSLIYKHRTLSILFIEV